MKAIAIITIIVAAIWFFAAISAKGMTKRWIPVVTSLALLTEAILALCLSWGAWTQIIIIAAVVLVYYLIEKTNKSI